MFLPWWIGVYVAAPHAYVCLAFCFVKRKNDFTFLLLLQCFDGVKRAAVLWTVFQHEAWVGHGRGFRECTTIMASIPHPANCWFCRGRKWVSPLLEHFLERRKSVGPFAHYWWYNLFWNACGLVSPNTTSHCICYETRLSSTSRMHTK